MEADDGTSEALCPGGGSDQLDHRRGDIHRLQSSLRSVAVTARHDGAVIVQDDFLPVARDLRQGIIEHSANGDVALAGEAGERTLATNAELALGRAALLWNTYLARSRRSTLRGVRVLDAGCGFGSVALAFAAAGASVLGIDPKGDRLSVAARIASRHGLDAHFTSGRVEALEVGSERFDLVVVNNAFCYLLDKRQRAEAMVGLHDALVPGGWIVVREPNRASLVDPFSRLPIVHRLPPRAATRAAARLGRHRSTVRLMTPRRAVAALRAGGFVDARYDGPGGRRRRGQRLARYHHTSARRPDTAGPGDG